MTRSSNQLHARRSGPRSALLRLFAVFLALLALGGQQRAVRTVRVAAAPATLSHVAPRSETIETNALRVAASARVAPAPVLARLPVVFTSVASARSPSARLYLAGAARVQRAERVTHFHSKRRIPRMNSEEPPRG